MKSKEFLAWKVCRGLDHVVSFLHRKRICTQLYELDDAPLRNLKRELAKVWKPGYNRDRAEEAQYYLDIMECIELQGIPYAERWEVLIKEGKQSSKEGSVYRAWGFADDKDRGGLALQIVKACNKVLARTKDE